MTKQQSNLKIAEESFKAFQKLQAEENFLAASESLKRAMQYFEKAGNSEKFKECKSKIREVNQKASENFQKASFEETIPKEIAEEFINFYLKENDTEIILQKIGHSPDLYPNFDAVSKRSTETMPVSMSICSMSVIDSTGDNVKGGTDSQNFWFLKCYEFHQGIITQLFLRNLFISLIEEKKMNLESLVSFLKNSKIIPEDNLKIIRCGLSQFFSNDFISAMHILVPQFESLFLHLSGKLGIDTVKKNRGTEVSTENKIFNSGFLKDPKVQKAWGKDLCEQINFIFCEPLGWKFRHKIAHGNIASEECNFSNTCSIIYLFIVLCTRVSPQKY